MKKVKHNYKIKIPHIFYSVNVIDIKKASPRAKDYLAKGFLACTEKGKHSSTIYIKLPIKQNEVPTLCHELVHVLQHICQDKDIWFADEQEHCAYIFQYMLNEILGYEFC